ncbi:MULTISPECIES: acyl carrier protein [Pseudomonas]|uniref:acyl carrier protein n=1 Tax=Pseudomonas TaxID=286 RepID=UPI000DA6CB0A|nr:acyl carrier protein [Pseudomonas sichuanensis]
MTSFEVVTADKDTVVHWCREQIGQLLNAPASTVDERKDFSELGLDSSLAVSLLIEIEQAYGVEISAEELFDNPSITAVASLIVARSRKA